MTQSSKSTPLKGSAPSMPTSSVMLTIKLLQIQEPTTYTDHLTRPNWGDSPHDPCRGRPDTDRRPKPPPSQPPDVAPSRHDPGHEPPPARRLDDPPAHLDPPAPAARRRLDTETTDLDGQICELSSVDAHGRILLDTLIRPTCPITPAARAVHGITDEDLAGAPTLAQLWPTIAWLLHDARIAAYNAPFDRDALIRSCAAHGIDPGPAADPRRWTCIMRARSRVERRRWQRLDAGHRALGDAQAAREVLDAIAHGRLLATGGVSVTSSTTSPRSRHENLAYRSPLTLILEVRGHFVSAPPRISAGKGELEVSGKSGCRRLS